jgi:hypothetical protein
MSRTKHRCFMITVRPHGCMTDDQIAEVRLKIESTYAHYHLVEEFANETLPETRHVHALLFLPEDKASTVSKFNEKWRRFLKPWEKDTETQVRIAFQGSFVYDEKALEYITPETEKNNEKKEKGGKTVILKSQLPDDLEEYYSDPPKKKQTRQQTTNIPGTNAIGSNIKKKKKSIKLPLPSHEISYIT